MFVVSLTLFVSVFIMFQAFFILLVELSIRLLYVLLLASLITVVKVLQYRL